MDNNYSMTNMWTWQPPTPTQRKYSSLQPWDTEQRNDVQEQQGQLEQYPLYCNESMPNPSIASDILSSSHKKSAKSNGSYQLFPQPKQPLSGFAQRPAGGSHVEYSRKAGSDEEKLRRKDGQGVQVLHERFTVGSLPAQRKDPTSHRYSEKEPHSRLRLSQGAYQEAEGSLSEKIDRGSIDHGSHHEWSDTHSYKEFHEAGGPAEEVQDIDIENLIANFDRNLLGGFESISPEIDSPGQGLAEGSPPDNSGNGSNQAGGSGDQNQSLHSQPSFGMKDGSSSGQGSANEHYRELELFTSDLLVKFETVLQSKRTNAKTHELPAEEWGKVAQDLQQAKISFTPAELVDLSKAGREESLKAQSYLKTLSPDQLDVYAKHFEPQLDVLMTNKFANYVVQHLLTVHPPTLTAVEQVSLAKFATLVNDEYGSRTMQKACQNNPGYVSRAMASFMTNFESLISTIAGSIFLCKLVSSTNSKTDHRLPLEPLKLKKEHLQNSYYTRVLSTIAGICDEEILAQIVELVSDNMWHLMNDKFGNYLVLVFFDRNQQAGIKLVTDTCLKNSSNLVSRKFPKFVLLRLLRAKQHEPFVRELAEQIVTQPLDSLLSYIGRKENVAVFLLIVGRLSPMLIEKYLKPLFQEIAKESTDKTHLAAELIDNLKRLLELTEKANRSLPCLVDGQKEPHFTEG